MGTILGTIAIVLITVAVGLLINRKHKLLPDPATLSPAATPKPKPPQHAAGEAPATAIRARDSQLANLRNQRCAKCRARTIATPSSSSTRSSRVEDPGGSEDSPSETRFSAIDFTPDS